MNIVILKYHAGNVRSVTIALERLGIHALLSDNHSDLLEADKIIFPGVGEAHSAMDYLKEKNLDTLIPKLKKPFLGICLGMQLLCQHSEEGNTKGIGIFNTKVKHFISPEHRGASRLEDCKVPQIGWNRIRNLKGPLFEGLSEECYMYFVHGYFAGLSDQTAAATEYILPYSSALRKDNFYAVQFHPEKSGEAGKRVLQNFIELC